MTTEKGTSTLPLSIIGREIHVWCLPVDSEHGISARFQDVLSPDELARATHYRTQKLQDAFIFRRGVLRCLVERYTGIAAEEIRFRYGSNGKPELTEQSLALRFNVSHSSGVALLGFTVGCPIGLDIERIRPLEDFETMARGFCPEEVFCLMKLPVAERPLGFFQAWTRKEAFVKATGDGLNKALNSFAVTLGNGDEAGLLHVGYDEGEAARWTLHDLDLSSEQVAALAYKDSRRPVRILQPSDAAELRLWADAVTSVPSV